MVVTGHGQGSSETNASKAVSVMNVIESNITVIRLGICIGQLYIVRQQSMLTRSCSQLIKSYPI